MRAGRSRLPATRIFIPGGHKYFDGAAARDAAIIFVLARLGESDRFF
jgi:hypothetical protein